MNDSDRPKIILEWALPSELEFVASKGRLQHLRRCFCQRLSVQGVGIQLPTTYDASLCKSRYESVDNSAKRRVLTFQAWELLSIIVQKVCYDSVHRVRLGLFCRLGVT